MLTAEHPRSIYVEMNPIKTTPIAQKGNRHDDLTSEKLVEGRPGSAMPIPIKNDVEGNNGHGKTREGERPDLIEMSLPSRDKPNARSSPIISASVGVHTSTPSRLKVAAVVGFYILSSITMIMVNKAVLNQTGLPLFFLWGQLVLAVVFLRLASLAGFLRLPPVTMALLFSVAPLIAINVIGLILNTLCLQNIDAVMYQVARSLILPMTVTMSPFLQRQRVSASVLGCCILISFGFMIGVFGERTFTVSPSGIIFGVLSSFTTALHSFIIKSSFQSVKHNGAFDLVYYNNLFSAILLAPILVLEVGQLQSFVSVGGWPAMRVFLFGTTIAGATGLLINLAGFLQIKVTSPVTHTVSSAARGVLQTLAARAILGEAITIARSIGIVVTLVGSCAYSIIKSKENAAPSREYNKVESHESPSNSN